MPPGMLNERIIGIKDNNEEIERLIEEYKPFIASFTSKVAKRFVTYGEDDELSIALLAFVEAIKAYDLDKGNFLNFSGQVMKRRLIDYYRKEKKQENVIFFNSYGTEENKEADLSVYRSLDKFSDDNAAEMRRLEIEQLRKELSEWGINFFELAACSPKHKKTQKICNDIVGFLLSDPGLMKGIRSSNQLPVSEIEKGLRIPRKIVERFRKYIISVLLVETGDYQYIKEYAAFK